MKKLTVTLSPYLARRIERDKMLVSRSHGGLRQAMSLPLRLWESYLRRDDPEFNQANNRSPWFEKIIYGRGTLERKAVLRAFEGATRVQGFVKDDGGCFWVTVTFHKADKTKVSLEVLYGGNGPPLICNWR